MKTHFKAPDANLSQLGRFADMGEQQSKVDEHDAQTKAKLEARVKSLTAIAVDLAKLQTRLASLPEMEKPKRLARLTASISALREIQDRKVPVGAAAPLRKAMNELVSLREGVFTDSVKAHELATVNLNAAIEELQKSRVTAQEKLETVAVKGSQFTKEDALEEIFRKASEVIKKSGKEAATLESISKRPFVVARVPVVPVTQPLLDPNKLVKLGIKADSIAGYAVIHNQLVIGVNKEELQKKGRKSETAHEAAERILKVLVAQTKQKLMFVADAGYPYKGGVWYWVANERDAAAFAKAAGGRLLVKQWGFAF